MKYTFFALLVVAVIGVGMFWMKSAPADMPETSLAAGEATPTPAESFELRDGTYALDPAVSVMTWAGSKKIIKDYVDRGSISLLSGTTVVMDGKVASGSVVVDMNSIVASSTGRGGGQDGLARHLKSADFFDTEKFPTATFTLIKLTGSENGMYRVEGTLTLKGVTEAVAFDATVKTQGEGRIVMDARSIQLDRTKWQVKYGSDSFFDNLGDNVINNVFEVSFTAVGVLSAAQ